MSTQAADASEHPVKAFEKSKPNHQIISNSEFQVWRSQKKSEFQKDYQQQN